MALDLLLDRFTVYNNNLSAPAYLFIPTGTPVDVFVILMYIWRAHPHLSCIINFAFALHRKAHQRSRSPPLSQIQDMFQVKRGRCLFAMCLK